MIRAHQCKEEGVGFAYTDNRVDTFTFPYVTTLFSAANYCGSHGNKAALLVFYEDDIQVYNLINRVAMVISPSPQVVKITQAGEVTIEQAPYHKPSEEIKVQEEEGNKEQQEVEHIPKEVIEQKSASLEPEKVSIGIDCGFYCYSLITGNCSHRDHTHTS